MKTHSDQRFKSAMKMLEPHLKRINNREARWVDVEMFKKVLAITLLLVSIDALKIDASSETNALRKGGALKGLPSRS